MFSRCLIMNNSEFREQLLNVYKEQDKVLQQKYNRSLSLQDGLVDRFERAKDLGFGDGASIYNSALVYGDVAVGSKTWIGPYVVLDASGGSISIGAYCSISAGVHIYTHDSVMWALSGGKDPYHQGAVLIGNNTYIGAQSIIKAGTQIGNTCLIGANSFVNRNVEDNSIVIGNPGRVVGKVIIDGEQIRLLYF